jgi:hypothetical protein
LCVVVRMLDYRASKGEVLRAKLPAIPGDTRQVAYRNKGLS